MSVLLRLGLLYLPPSVKKKRLKQLIDLTSGAFGCDAPSIEGASVDEILLRYARFTREEADKLAGRPEERERVREKLYRDAYTLGCELRKAFRIGNRRDALLMGRIVYKAVKIDFRTDGANGIVIRRCFFSSHYPAEVCALVSAIDEGIMAGLSSGLRLRFRERITEGSGCCRAGLGPGEVSS